MKRWGETISYKKGYRNIINDIEKIVSEFEYVALKSYIEGYKTGESEGYEDGYDEGYHEGKNEGYEGGYDEGYYDGKEG